MCVSLCAEPLGVCIASGFITERSDSGGGVTFPLSPSPNRVGANPILPGGGRGADLRGLLDDLLPLKRATALTLAAFGFASSFAEGFSAHVLSIGVR